MRNLIIYLGALSALSSTSSAVRHGAAQLRDLLAYPKYEVQFLNDLPVSTTDADRAKSLGVEREDEWLHLRLGLHDRKRLSDGQVAEPSEDRLRLVPMALTPPGSLMQADYLCLMPSANSTDSQTARMDLDELVELDPVQSWAALSHLDGKCLYSKQGWFTYSYCHNSHIRQFREARHRHPHPPGGHEPEEDPTFDAYTLGQAHAAPPSRRASTRKGSSGAGSGSGGRSGSDSPQTRDHTPSISNPSVSFAESASSRYLVQRWSDGTTCDKTGQPREIEVQVHCSMTTTDVIYLVKEMAICQYVLIIHSPHLCGLPGFRAPHADVQPAGIRCRQVIGDEEFEGWAQKVNEPSAGAGDVADAARLGLPWQLNRRVGGREGIKVGMRDGSGGDDSVEQGQQGDESTDPGAGEDPLVYEMDALDLQQFLIDALGEYDAGEGEATTDEFVLLSLEEDEDGNMILDTDLLGQDGARLKAVEGNEREALLKAVRRYLDSKPEIKRDQTMGDDDAEEGDSEDSGHSEDAAVERQRDEL